jgi:ADP-ribosylglycohydrolase
MVTLKDRFRGCVAASWIGSAMGAAVEGWSPEDIKAQHRVLDRLVSYAHYDQDVKWNRTPGTTEDGIERQKLIATAIIEKGDRALAQDVAAIWVRDIDPAKIIYKQEPFDRGFLELARAGLPASEMGQLYLYPNVVSLARSAHPLGLINAGDARGAADDAFEVGKLYARETAYGVRWAALYVAALAEACRPNATVASILETAKEFVHYREEGQALYARYDTIESEVVRALELAEKHSDPMEMRDEFYRYYSGGDYFNYGMSQANEIVAKGLAVFAITRGNPREAIIAAVNFGRDTDCLAAVAGGLAGAFSGTAALPKEWTEQVNAATKKDPYTNNQRTIEETADGLFNAFLSRRQRLRDYVESMGDEEFLAT